MAAKKAPEPVNVLRGHTSDVQALAFLPDGRLLAGCACSARPLQRCASRRQQHMADVARAAMLTAPSSFGTWACGARRTRTGAPALRRSPATPSLPLFALCARQQQHVALTRASARLRRRPARRAHSASAGVLGVGAVPGVADALLTQGRDGTLKRWQVRAPQRACALCFAAERAPLAPSAAAGRFTL
jgi:WD40 repeat protein